MSTTTTPVRFGLTLPNRGVMFGITTPDQMLEMAEIADRSEVYESIWVGDSLLGKPRMESVALLCAVAARTKRLRLGEACMASFPLRDPVLLAYQWASLDLLSGGRSVLVVCTGIVPQAVDENRLYRVTNRDRVKRMIEGITVLKRLWTEDDVTFQGAYYELDGITIGPKPVQKPHPPIWIASNARGDPKLVDITLRRVAELAEGWQVSTGGMTAQRFGEQWQRILEHAVDLGRDPNSLENQVYHNINVNEDRQKAYDESKWFLDTYYGADYDQRRLDNWVSYGPPEACIDKLNTFVAQGAQSITLRISAVDQMGQLKRCIEEVLPFVQAQRTDAPAVAASGREG